MRDRPLAETDRDIAALGPWFHNLHLPDGRQTAPDHPFGDFPGWKWRELAPHLPADLTGWSALDIGCNAGFYSFELCRRGATVTAIDCDMRYLRQARWAAEQMGVADRITFERRQIHSLARERRRFDLVLFLGVFYHLRYPMLALDTIALVRPKLMVFQTLQTAGEAAPAATDGVGFDSRASLDAPGWPKLSFLEHGFAGDPTNCWVPNQAAVAALLRSAGFTIAARPAHETYVCRADPAHRLPYWVLDEWRAATADAGD